MAAAWSYLATAGLTLEIKSFALHYDRIMITPRSNLRAGRNAPLHAPQRFATRIALICCSLSLLSVPRGIINAFCNRPTVNAPYRNVPLSFSSRIYLSRFSFFLPPPQPFPLANLVSLSRPASDQGRLIIASLRNRPADTVVFERFACCQFRETITPCVICACCTLRKYNSVAISRIETNPPVEVQIEYSFLSISRPSSAGLSLGYFLLKTLLLANVRLCNRITILKPYYAPNRRNLSPAPSFNSPRRD